MLHIVSEAVIIHGHGVIIIRRDYYGESKSNVYGMLACGRGTYVDFTCIRDLEECTRN